MLEGGMVDDPEWIVRFSCRRLRACLVYGHRSPRHGVARHRSVAAVSSASENTVPWRKYFACGNEWLPTKHPLSVSNEELVVKSGNQRQRHKGTCFFMWLTCSHKLTKLGNQ